MSNWNAEFAAELAANGECASDIIACTLTADEMAEPADFHSHGPRIRPNEGFMAWTAEFVYYSHEYDSAISCQSIRRNPPQS